VLNLTLPVITVFTAVSFAKVPFTEVGRYAQEILNRGWIWSRNDVDWIYHFRKDFAETPSATADAEKEIADIMGEYYVGGDELKQRAEQWREFMLGQGRPPNFASAEDMTA
jgi:hypothetical protein